MRLAEREIREGAAICAILDVCDVMTLGLLDEGAPYVVPVNFDYKWEQDRFTFYFHCATEGKKLDCLRANPRVALNCCRFADYHGGDETPPHGKKEDYVSVSAVGRARELEGEEGAEALRQLAWRTASDPSWQKIKRLPGNLCMVAIDVEQLTCKVENPDPAWLPELLRQLQAAVRVRPRASK